MGTTTHAFVLWLMLFAYALHILEEHTLNWLGWARSTLKLDLSWADFYVTRSRLINTNLSRERTTRSARTDLEKAKNRRSQSFVDRRKFLASYL